MQAVRYTRFAALVHLQFGMLAHHTRGIRDVLEPLPPHGPGSRRELAGLCFRGNDKQMLDSLVAAWQHQALSVLGDILEAVDEPAIALLDKVEAGWPGGLPVKRIISDDDHSDPPVRQMLRLTEGEDDDPGLWR